MNKFNEFVETILENNSIEIINEAVGKEQITGEQWVTNMVNIIEPYSPEVARNIEEEILNSAKYDDQLSQVLNTPQKVAELGKILGITANIMQINNPPKPAEENVPGENVPGDKTKLTPRQQLGSKPGFNITKGPLQGLGAKYGSTHMADIEKAFWDTAYDWKQGTVLKKLQMVGSNIGKIGKGIGKGVAGFLLPTAKGSTGVFA